MPSGREASTSGRMPMRRPAVATSTIGSIVEPGADVRGSHRDAHAGTSACPRTASRASSRSPTRRGRRCSTAPRSCRPTRRGSASSARRRRERSARRKSRCPPAARPRARSRTPAAAAAPVQVMPVSGSPMPSTIAPSTTLTGPSPPNDVCSHLPSCVPSNSGVQSACAPTVPWKPTPSTASRRSVCTATRDVVIGGHPTKADLCPRALSGHRRVPEAALWPARLGHNTPCPPPATRCLSPPPTRPACSRRSPGDRRAPGQHPVHRKPAARAATASSCISSST